MLTSRLLAAYDDQLRTDVEVRRAAVVRRLGPLHLAAFDGGFGLITYRGLDQVPPAELPALVGRARDRLLAEGSLTRIEWKTRAHDGVQGLSAALLAHGFVAGERESIMIGELRGLDSSVQLPDRVTLRPVTTTADIRAMAVMQEQVFGTSESSPATDAWIADLRADPDTELWVAEHDGTVISAGRVQRVPGSDFVGLWGGATLPQWRGRGIYRALTAARARSALASGYRLAHSDSTEFSRPILQRAGLVRVSTTTPYLWRTGTPPR